MGDPTYDKDEISKRPDWNLAFIMSEMDNDNAPLGWSEYIPLAQMLLDHFTITPKDRPHD